ncbi:alpha/beta hydrolase [Pseudomonadota bacterium]
MPYLDIRHSSIYYEETGSGSETLVFSHGLLMSSEMFRDQVKAFSSRYRCIAYDHRGQGRSGVSKTGYDMDSLTDDAVELIRQLDCAPCHFAGLSMGGFVGMRLAIHHPELVKSLILMETTADPEPEENKGPYRRLAFVGRWLSYRLVANPVMKIMFGNTFLQDPVRSETRAYWKKHLMSLRRTGTSKAAHGVIDREGVYDQLGRIDTPTLILVGDEDVATPLPKSERMHEAIRNSKLQVIPNAGHSVTIEEPAAITAAMKEFLPV